MTVMPFPDGRPPYATTLGDIFGAKKTSQMPPMSASAIPSGPMGSLQAQKPKHDANFWIGIIGDALSTFGGGKPVYLSHMLDQQETERERQQREQEAGMEHARDRADFDYRTNNTPYRWESNDGSLMEMGTDRKPRVVYKDPTPKTEWINVRNPDGTMTIMPKPQGGPLPTFGPEDWDKGTPIGGAGSGQQGFR
jgi:hypothetical protein